MGYIGPVRTTYEVLPEGGFAAPPAPETEPVPMPATAPVIDPHDLVDEDDLDAVR